MSSLAILPLSTIDFNSTTATPSEQTVFQNILGRLEQSVGNGDLTTAQTLLNSVNALSPSSASQSNPLGTFLTNLTTALQDGSTTEATSALTTYQNATATDSTTTTTGAPATTAQATAAQITTQLIQSQNQTLVTSAFASLSANAQSSSSDSNTGVDSLYSLLNAAYGHSSTPSSSPSSTPSTSLTSSTSSTSTTPYDTLVSSIQASLAAGDGTLTPALAYLQASGNFVNTTA